MSETLTPNGKDVRKFRVNGIPVRLGIPPSNPVAQGVIEGLNMIEDPMRRISMVSVFPDTKLHPEGKDLFSQGTCYCNNSGLSEITIWAGSIKETAVDQQSASCTALLHEAGHADQESQEHAGLYLDTRFTSRERENFAEDFAFKQRQAAYSKRHSSNHHHRTMRDILRDILEKRKSRKR